MQLAMKVAGNASLIHQREFAPLWLPLLRDLIGILEKNEIPLSTPRYHHISAAILEEYVFSFRRHKRSQIKPWGRRPQPHHLRLCMLLGYERIFWRQRAAYLKRKPSPSISTTLSASA
ncbi:hypothetical protein B0H66DRAFT_73915 [Apodospora peruviana]|uniref:Uncharacterized protein n=1 Tax=Apodospora peruviana TaxID=516989 RepID=A0AAE0MH28_9PEZI|nr:hypothetical protein B0H66DRAFT_73915 [Apodospora peruviana]